MERLAFTSSTSSLGASLIIGALLGTAMYATLAVLLSGGKSDGRHDR